MARAEKGEIMHQNELDIPKEYLRFATPAEVAKYRAERLKCKTIVEIGAGIGGQTMAFADTCDKVIAVEKDEKMLQILNDSLHKLGITNVELVHGDILAPEVIEKVKKSKPNRIFCDTERAEAGKRTINDLKPDIFELIKVYSLITREIAVEIPPFTSDVNKLKGVAELEFISLNGELNRLTVYFNELKQSNRSVVSLPSKLRLEDTGAENVEVVKKIEDYKFLYTIDPAIVLAGLVNELSKKLGLKAIELEGKLYLVSEKQESSSFLKAYQILSICKDDYVYVLEELKKLNAGKVVLRYSIDPAGYWNIRKRYEERLEGKEKIHLFKDYKKTILCKSLEYE